MGRWCFSRAVFADLHCTCGRVGYFANCFWHARLAHHRDILTRFAVRPDLLARASCARARALAGGHQRHARRPRAQPTRRAGAAAVPWLDRLDSNNSQGEYYLTDVIAMAVADGVPVHGVKAADWKEVMGINDRKHAEAERALQQRRVDELMEQGVSFADKYRTVIGDGVFIGSGV